MSSARGFPPVASEDAEILILGSMPGKRSLQVQQYYAHPKNAFWWIMEELFRLSADSPYEQRLQLLIRNRIALWDLVATCNRPGSLDTSIDEASIVVNDFSSFYRQHPRIRSVFFNGAKAEQSYRRYVTPSLKDWQQKIYLHRLPSTSPANAGLTPSMKLEQWRLVYTHLHAT